MRDDGLEWHDDKAAINFRDHGVTFETARAAFDDPDHFEVDDPDPHEVRFNRGCRYETDIFVVTYTERGDRIRIISARPATRHEQRLYFGQ